MDLSRILNDYQQKFDFMYARGMTPSEPMVVIHDCDKFPKEIPLIQWGKQWVYVPKLHHRFLDADHEFQDQELHRCLENYKRCEIFVHSILLTGSIDEITLRRMIIEYIRLRLSKKTLLDLIRLNTIFSYLSLLNLEMMKNGFYFYPSANVIADPEDPENILIIPITPV